METYNNSALKAGTVAVKVGVMVGVSVGKGVNVAVGEGVKVAVGSGVGVSVGSGVAVGVGVSVGMMPQPDKTNPNKVNKHTYFHKVDFIQFLPET